MKPESIQRLTQALALLPPAPNNHCLGHFICALLYLKAWSASWYWHAAELNKAGQSHLSLVCLDQDSVTAHQYQFNLQMYGPEATAFYAQAVDTVLPI